MGQLEPLKGHGCPVFLVPTPVLREMEPMRRISGNAGTSYRALSGVADRCDFCVERNQPFRNDPNVVAQSAQSPLLAFDDNELRVGGAFAHLLCLLIFR